MALSRSLLGCLLLLALATQLVHSIEPPASAPVSASAIGGQGCLSACKWRCSRSWKLEMCMKLCLICCGKCKCVPPGPTMEARAKCPCYANMKSTKGQSKCP